MVSEVDDIKTIVSPYRPVLFFTDGVDMSLPAHAVHGIRFRDASSVKATLVNALRSEAGFVISIRGAVDHELFVFLMHALLSPKYLTVDDQPVIFVDRDFADSDLNVLQQKLSQQGFHEVKFWSLAGSGNAVAVNDETILTRAWAKDQLFQSFASLSGFVVFDFNESDLAAGAYTKLANFCQEYFDANPAIEIAFNEYQSLKSKFEKLKGSAGKLQQQLASSEKTVSVIRTKYKDDYENLFKWYHNEYEVLPLWYKRFGHIIKVIMGKRSFRSLFSDDVKKYKD